MPSPLNVLRTNPSLSLLSREPGLQPHPPKKRQRFPGSEAGSVGRVQGRKLTPRWLNQTWSRCHRAASGGRAVHTRQPEVRSGEPWGVSLPKGVRGSFHRSGCDAQRWRRRKSPQAEEREVWGGGPHPEYLQLTDARRKPAEELMRSPGRHFQQGGPSLDFSSWTTERLQEVFGRGTSTWGCFLGESLGWKRRMREN